MDTEEFVQGIFIEEVKNRFLCMVSVQSRIMECYIPSSCRLDNFIDLKGRSVLLKKNQTKGCRTKYSVYAVKVGRTFVLLNLSQSNKILKDNIHKPLFSFLGKRNKVIQEKKVADYKCDLFIEDTQTIIEIKSILSISKSACFPTVYSERGIKQLNQLCSLMDNDYHVCYILASLNPSVREIILNNKDSEYSRHFLHCINKGMTCVGLSIKLLKHVPVIHGIIPVRY